MNIDRQRIYIRCPRCTFYARPFLRQVRHGETVICGGCKSNIRLEDHLGSYLKAQRKLQRALDELTSSLGDMNITIRL